MSTKEESSTSRLDALSFFLSVDLAVHLPDLLLDSAILSDPM